MEPPATTSQTVRRSPEKMLLPCTLNPENANFTFKNVDGDRYSIVYVFALFTCIL